jgi:hypothetical protein
VTSPRPREPHPLHRPVSPTDVLRKRDLIRSFVTENRTEVNGNVTIRFGDHAGSDAGDTLSSSEAAWAIARDSSDAAAMGAEMGSVSSSSRFSF